MKTLQINKFINDANKVHNYKYDYTLVEYINNKTKVKIICPYHGIFQQTPNNHSSNNMGCKSCAYEYQQEHRSGKIMGQTYVKSDTTKNKITTPRLPCIHNIKPTFTPQELLVLSKTDKMKSGRYLGKQPIEYQNEYFILAAKEIHGDTYDYSKSIYNTKGITIICKEHGNFTQRPEEHLNRKSGCKKCAIKFNLIQKGIYYTKEVFINKVRSLFNNQYDLSELNYNSYKDYNVPQTIICVSDRHDLYKFKIKPSRMINSKMGGCKKCALQISSYENEICNFLKSENIKFIQGDCSKLKGCGLNKGNLELDIYLPDYNIGIEINGNVWHSELIKSPDIARIHMYHKHNECTKKGIILLQFYTDEIKNNLINVCNNIKFTINSLYNDISINYNIKNIKVIDSITAHDFNTKFNITNIVSSNLHYGLYYKKNLISVLSMSIIYTNTVITSCTITAFSNKYYNSSILLDMLNKFICDNPSCNNIDVIIDNRLNHSYIYSNLGFIKIADIDPECMYISRHDSYSNRYNPNELDTLSKPVRIWNSGYEQWSTNL